MSAQRGGDMLLKMKNDEGAYVTVAGLRTKTLRLNARPVDCLLYTSPSPRDATLSRMPSSA